MKRREFITLVGGTASWPLVTRAQQAERVRRIGVLLPAAADNSQFQTWVGAFLQELAVLAGPSAATWKRCSTSRPPRRSASIYRRPCSRAPTR
jgi:hypothetical protein